MKKFDAWFVLFSLLSLDPQPCSPINLGTFNSRAPSLVSMNEWVFSRSCGLLGMFPIVAYGADFVNEVRIPMSSLLEHFQLLFLATVSARISRRRFVQINGLYESVIHRSDDRCWNERRIPTGEPDFGSELFGKTCSEMVKPTRAFKTEIRLSSGLLCEIQDRPWRNRTVIYSIFSVVLRNF